METLRTTVKSRNNPSATSQACLLVAPKPCQSDMYIYTIVHTIFASFVVWGYGGFINPAGSLGVILLFRVARYEKWNDRENNGLPSTTPINYVCFFGNPLNYFWLGLSLKPSSTWVLTAPPCNLKKVAASFRPHLKLTSL